MKRMIQTQLLLQNLRKLGTQATLEWAQNEWKQPMETIRQILEEALALKKKERKTFIRESLKQYQVPNAHIEPILKAIYQTFPELGVLPPTPSQTIEQKARKCCENEKHHCGLFPFLTGIGLLSTFNLFENLQIQTEHLKEEPEYLEEEEEEEQEDYYINDGDSEEEEEKEDYEEEEAEVSNDFEASIDLILAEVFGNVSDDEEETPGEEDFENSLDESPYEYNNEEDEEEEYIVYEDEAYEEYEEDDEYEDEYED